MDKFVIDTKIYKKYTKIVEKEVFSQLEQNYNILDSLKQSILMILYNRLTFFCDETVLELQDIEIGKVNLFYKINKDLADEDEKKQGAKNLYKLVEEQGIDLLFDKNKGLEKILDEKTDKYCKFIVESISRIYNDKDIIRETFFKNKKQDEDFKVLTIKSESADLHNGNKSTLILHTSLGKLIYKPHDMQFDVFSYDFFNKYFYKWVYIPNALAMNSYGYSEFIEDEDTESDESIYYNSGALAAIFVALGSIDFHLENILRLGNRPALIDLETILTPKRMLLSNEKEGFNYDISNSIYCSGMLPIRANSYQTSIFFNTEDKNKLALKIDGEKVSINEYYRAKYPNLKIQDFNYETFFNGFDEAYFFILEHKNEISEFLNKARNLINRVILRNTDNYVGLLKYTTKSYVAIKNDSYQIILKGLSKEIKVSKQYDFENVVKYEAKAIVNGDVPYFYCNNADHNLYDGDGNIAKENYFEKTGIQNAIFHLNCMSKDENEFEKSIIKFSFRNALEDKKEDIAKKENSLFYEYLDRYKKNEKKEIDVNDLLSLKRDIENDVIDIHNSFVDNAIKSANGYYGYLALNELDFSNAKAGIFLGDGYLGVLLFLCSFYRYFDGKDIKNLKPSKDIYFSLIKELSNDIESFENKDKDLISCLPVGLVNGIGGIYKVLCLMYELSGDKQIYNLCIKIINILNDKYYPSDAILIDMYGGISGLLYSLLSEQRFLPFINKDLIVRLSNYLLEKKTLKYKEYFLWDTLGKGWAISGYAHGISGIAVALNLASRYLKNEKLKNAFIDAVNYEYNIYSDKIKTWPDLRQTEASDDFMHGICSGAPGIGISMLSYLENGYDSSNENINTYILKNIDRAIDKCINEDLLYRDILCCGNFSSIEFFIELLNAMDKNKSNILCSHKEDQIKLALYNQLKFIHERYLDNHEFTWLTPKFYNVYYISFTHGYSGIGYELLRFLNKDMIKSVFNG